jgi:nicotinamidase/pyrazinamidase
MGLNAETLLRSGDALVLVDVQCDFLPGGRLAVPEGDAVVPLLNAWIERFVAVGLPITATRDWHPPDHCSFDVQGGPWPQHCVIDTPGAAFAPGLRLPVDMTIVSKGTHPDDLGYSAFAETGLHRQLQQLGVRRVFVGGLATDYCVLNTVLDAIRLGYEVVLLTDCIRPVDCEPGDGERAISRMRAAGAVVMGG